VKIVETTALHKLSKLVSALCAVNWPVVLTGDLECPETNWSTVYAPNDGVQNKRFSVSREFGMVQMIDVRTRGPHIRISHQ
jgi:hypothetical protein